MSSNASSERQKFPGAAYAVAGWHAVRLSQADLAVLRKPPNPLPGAREAPSLKHSDDQTVAALTALCRAMQGCELAEVDYDRWGIVASSRFIGRGAIVGTVDKYANDGPWGVSMQVTPHQTVHAISSTISLALQCHGPCIGAGGGPHDESSAVLAAISLLQRPGVPGVWLVFTGWEPELTIDRAGKATSDSGCVAAALAVLPAPPAKHHSALRILGTNISGPAETPPRRQTLTAERGRLTMLFGEASQALASPVSMQAELGHGLRLEMELRPAMPAAKTAVPLPTPVPLPTAAILAPPHFSVGGIAQASPSETRSATTL